MKKLIVLSIIAAGMPLGLFAQDDMYFVPTKELAEQTARDYGMPRDTYYIGSSRSVDEYNRRGSYVEFLDSLGNDTINFDAVVGIYPDSTSLEASEYRYTHRMSRFDGYEPSSDYWAGYYDGRNSWHSPWYYDPWYYSTWRYRYGYYGWYDPWYDPWYYGHVGWYSPWRYGWYGGGWYSRWYVPRVSVVSYSRPYGRSYGHYSTTGRAPRGIRNGHSTRYSHGTFGGTSVRNGTFGGRTNTYNNTRSTYTPRTSGSGSFGGGHSGGSFSGGGHSGGSHGGGGHFGGRR